MVTKIILDTNFLLIPFTQKVDIFEEIRRIILDKYHIFIIDKTIDEINKIIDTQSGKDKQAAKFALALIAKKRPTMIKTGKNDNNVDKEIINLLKNDDYIIATQDKALKELLKKLNKRMIVLRQRSHLAII